MDFDSGQLGFAGLNANVTVGSNTYTTPPLKDRARRAGTGIKREAT